MSTIENTLTQLKTIMATVDASPQKNADYVYAWPTDHTQISNILAQSTPPLPVIVVARDMSAPAVVRNYHLSAVLNVIPFEILVFLKPGEITNLDQAKAAIELEPDWVPAVSTVLSANRTLSGVALGIGDEQGLFTHQSGHIHFFEPRTFWGIRFVVPVRQEIS